MRPPAGLRALSGVAGRRIGRLHLISVALVMAVLLVVALAIDYSKSYPEISAHAAAHGEPVLAVLLRYSAYRAVDIVTRLLPMAALTGAFVAEVLRRQTRESVVLAMAGLSPARSLLGVAGVLVLLGAAQYALETHLRPRAVFAQVGMGIGSYAERFDRSRLGRPHWFVSGDLAVRARVRGVPRVELHDVSVFRGLGEGGVGGVVTAPLALPLGDGAHYALPQATVWTPEAGRLTGRTARGLTLRLPVGPARLRYIGIDGFYLPQRALTEIAKGPTGEDDGDIGTAVWRRRTAALLPGVFLLLGASLAQIGFAAQFTRPARVLIAGTAGYLAVVSVKLFWSLGDFGAIPPQAAVVGPLAVAGLLAAAIQLRLALRAI